MLKQVWLLLSIGIVLVVGLCVSRVAAQEPADGWAVTVYNKDVGGLQVITAHGLQPGPELPYLNNYPEINDVRLSPNGKYAVVKAAAEGRSYRYAADLTTGESVPLWADPINLDVKIIFLGPFSPDGTQIAASAFDENAFYERGVVTSLIVIFDLATGNVVASQPLSALHPENDYEIVAAFGEWKADGIRAVPSCYACEGVWKGLYQIWNPETNNISKPVEPFNIFMNQLPGTGEALKFTVNADYPQNRGQESYFPPANVVQYYSSVYESEGQVIYFNPDNPYVETAGWVADGQAIAVKTGGRPASKADDEITTDGTGESYLLFRDGHQVNLHPDLGYVLAGTPDGWITRNPINDSITLVTLNGNDVVATELGTSSQLKVAGTNFTLGANTTAAAFPLVTPPERVTCPGFVQSRLWRNTFANITPGESNNLRAEASTSSALIGKIPGGDIVAVLEGPVCSENMAWWQVQYKSRIGWTVEGQGSTYWIEP